MTRKRFVKLMMSSPFISRNRANHYADFALKSRVSYSFQFWVMIESSRRLGVAVDRAVLYGV